MIKRVNKINIPYGNTNYKIKLDEKFDLIKKKKLESIKDPGKELLEQYDNPIASSPLKDLIKDKKNIVIVVSDKTRPLPYKTIIQDTLLPYLERSGFDEKNISFLIAGGSHDIPDENEIIEILGKNIKERFRVYYNNCYNESDFVSIGYVEDGVDVKINKVYLDAEFRILTGLISPHPLAGFSGGRKSIVPGLCNYESLKLIHGVRAINHPGTRIGSLKYNMLHRIATTVLKRVGADFLINITLSSENKINGIFCGDPQDAFLHGANFSRNNYGINIEKKYDIAITHAGGGTKDKNFYQAYNGVHTVLPYVKEGGEIILIAGCDDGIGTEAYSSLIRSIDDLIAWEKNLEKSDFQMEQWALQSLCNIYKKFKVKIVSPLIDKEPCLKYIVEEVKNPNKYLQEKIRKNPGMEIGVFFDGPYFI